MSPQPSVLFRDLESGGLDYDLYCRGLDSRYLGFRSLDSKDLNARYLDSSDLYSRGLDS